MPSLQTTLPHCYQVTGCLVVPLTPLTGHPPHLSPICPPSASQPLYEVCHHPATSAPPDRVLISNNLSLTACDYSLSVSLSRSVNHLTLCVTSQGALPPEPPEDGLAGCRGFLGAPRAPPDPSAGRSLGWRYWVAGRAQWWVAGVPPRPLQRGSITPQNDPKNTPKNASMEHLDTPIANLVTPLHPLCLLGCRNVPKWA